MYCQPASQSVSQSVGQNNFEKLYWFPACLRSLARSLYLILPYGLADLRTAAVGSFHHWLPVWLFGKTIHKFAAEETAAPKTIVIKTMNCLASPLKTTESPHITRTEQQQLKLNFNFTPSR